MKSNYSPLLYSAPFFTPKSRGALALFGELFQRGYAHGLVDHAARSGYRLISATVGRREKDVLRPLTDEERKDKGHDFINIPLECGFDLFRGADNKSLVDLLKDIKLSEWPQARLDFDLIQQLKLSGEQDFRNRVRLYLNELDRLTENDEDLLIAHLMAGGIPRAKILMPLLNRMFKGTGDRYQSSELFWNSDLGRACSLSFEAVTADSFRVLLEEAEPLVQKRSSRGQKTRFTAYGYHGTAVRLQNEMQWQTYSPYLQGWAKLKLEHIAEEFFKKSYLCCVYNCPEILTQSSSVFQGVEVPLYTLLESLREYSTQLSRPKVWAALESRLKVKLKDLVSWQEIQSVCESFLLDPRWAFQRDFAQFPTHSQADQLENLILTSDRLISFHKDEKDLLTFPLSEIVFQACGHALFTDSTSPQMSVRWINHDYVANHYVMSS
jgi:hypothetical protein